MEENYALFDRTAMGGCCQGYAIVSLAGGAKNVMNADFNPIVPIQERKMVVGGKPLLRDAWSQTNADAKGLDETMNSLITGGTDTALNGSTRITLSAKSASSWIFHFNPIHV